MAQYRKKPVVIDAVRFNGLVGNGVEVEMTQNGLQFFIQTLEGKMIVRTGDWIITGVKGEKYPCKDDIFRATYEPTGPASEDDLEGDGMNCIRCGQSIAKRKVTFASILAHALIRAYFVASEKQAQIVNIRDLELPNAQYARINDLVRFGLLYKNEQMGTGDYGIPRKRVAEFLNNKWPVAAYFWKNPVTGENEMSEERIYFRDIPTTADLISQFGEKMTQYIRNDIETTN